MDRDKRKFKRVTYKGAKVLCFGADENRGANPYNYATHLVDVSLGGACVLSVGRLRPDARMILDVFFQQHQGGFRVPAVVRWSREVTHQGKQLYMSGLEFAARPEFTGRALDAVLGRAGAGIETKLRPAKPNRRKSDRVKVDVAEIECVPAGLLAGLGLASNVAKSLLDLSESGARFVSKKPLEAGKRFRLRVRIPRIGSALRMAAVVRWCREDKKDRYLIGVEFEDVPEESRVILRSLEKWFSRSKE